MQKILNIGIILTISLIFSFSLKAEEKKDCSQYSTKTLSGLSDKRRCEKGLPPKKNFFESLNIKKSKPEESISEKKINCDDYSTKTLTGLAKKMKCEKDSNNVSESSSLKKKLINIIGKVKKN